MCAYIVIYTTEARATGTVCDVCIHSDIHDGGTGNRDYV